MWTKKYKGSGRGLSGAWIHMHTSTEKAIVENYKGFIFNGQNYDSLEQAKAALLSYAFHDKLNKCGSLS